MSHPIGPPADQPLALTVAHYTAGFFLVHRPDLPRAIDELERSLHLSRTWKLPAWSSNIASILGYAYAQSGRMEEGVLLMQQAIEASRASGGMVNHASEVTRLGEAFLLAGRLDEAHELGQRALDLARKHKERGNEALALRLLAEVAVRRSPRDESVVRDLYGQAGRHRRRAGYGTIAERNDPGLGPPCRSGSTPTRARKSSRRSSTEPPSARRCSRRSSPTRRSARRRPPSSGASAWRRASTWPTTGSRRRCSPGISWSPPTSPWPPR